MPKSCKSTPNVEESGFEGGGQILVLCSCYIFSNIGNKGFILQESIVKISSVIWINNFNGLHAKKSLFWCSKVSQICKIDDM